MQQDRTLMLNMPDVLAGQLACIAGTLSGRSFNLSAGTFVIGRSAESDLQLIEEPGDKLAVMLQRMDAGIGGLVGKSQPEQIRHDEAQRRPGKLRGDLAVQEAPGGVAVQEQHRKSAPGLHDV